MRNLYTAQVFWFQVENREALYIGMNIGMLMAVRPSCLTLHRRESNQ